jgi:hypothetical protein
MFYIKRGKAEACGLVPSIAVKGLCGVCGWSGSLNKFEDHNQAHLDNAFGTDYVCRVLPLGGFEVDKKTGDPIRIKRDGNKGDGMFQGKTAAVDGGDIEKMPSVSADDGKAWDHTQKTPDEIDAAVEEATKQAEKELDADIEQGEDEVTKGGKGKKKGGQTNNNVGEQQTKGNATKAGRKRDNKNDNNGNINKKWEEVTHRSKRIRKATKFYEG